MGLLMSLDALLNETNQFEKLRKKLKNRRLDYDANNNKLQKCKKEDPFLEENVKSTKFKYEETLQKLEEMMITVNKKETELVDPFIDFMEMQISFYHDCLKTSESVLKVLKEGYIYCARAISYVFIVLEKKI
jgi:predicted nuclease with TOPRIM domain